MQTSARGWTPPAVFDSMSNTAGGPGVTIGFATCMRRGKAEWQYSGTESIDGWWIGGV